MKELLLVCVGSFFGGGMRYAVSKAVDSWSWMAFPFGTMAVNVAGCLLIGFLSGLSWSGNTLSPSVKLLLTTGFCGGFTTFSTFMNEGTSLLKDDQFVLSIAYLFGSIALGMAAVMAGHMIAKTIG